MLKAKELKEMGYTFLISMEVASTDREPEEILKSLNIESFDSLTIDNPKVKKTINGIIKHYEKKDKPFPEGGVWKLNKGTNDIGWTYIDVSYVKLEAEPQLTTCDVIDEDGVKKTLFLKEVPAEEIKDFKYFKEDGQLFCGKVISSETNIFKMKS